MSIVLDGTNGVTAPALTGPLDAAQLTGAMPVMDGSALTSVTAINGMPVGTLIYFGMPTPPAGFIKANGASLSTSVYSNLFAVLGYTYGGSGASFNLPDLRGEFMRGWDDARGLDAGRGFGSIQEQDWKSFYMTDTVQNGYAYSHNNVYMGKSTTGYIGNLFTGAWNAPAAAIGTMWDTSEIRPRNAAMLVCIKY
jgi:phage-related tail fiber protein